MESADEILYPNRPKEPLPPSTDISQLAGKYYADGFGTFDFEEETNDAAPGGGYLVAERLDWMWQMRWRLRHVSRDFWTLLLELVDGPQGTQDFRAAQFKIGVDNRPLGLEITLSSLGSRNGEKIFLKRIES